MVFLGRLLAIIILPLILFLAILIATSIWAQGRGKFRDTLADILDSLRTPPEGL